MANNYSVLLKTSLDKSNIEKDLSKIQRLINKNAMKILVDLDVDKLNKQISQIDKLLSREFGKEQTVKISTKDAITQVNKLKKTAQDASNVSMKIDLGKQNLSNNITSYLNKNTKLSKTLRNEILTLKNSIASVDDKSGLKNLEQQFKSVRLQARALGQEGKSFASGLKSDIGNFATFLTAGTVTMQAIRGIRQMISDVVDLDSAMVNLRKVTNATEIQFSNFFNSAADSAKELGATITDVINSTADFSKLGYNLIDAEELARVAVLYKNVGDIDISSATESLVSTMKGFQLSADEAERIVDVFNNIGNKYAISSAGIGEALQRSAASLYEANNTLEQATALQVGANNVIQDPEAVGTMWKTVSMRIRGAKTELEEAGLETEYMAETTSSLRKTIEGLTGFDILEPDNETFKSTYDIICGISDEYQKLTDIEQASLLETLAGKRQGNALAAALNNVDDIRASYEDAMNSAGSAMAEQEEYAKSIEYSLGVMQASLQELASTTIDSGLIKGVVDFGTGVVQVTNSVGGLVPVLTMLGVALGLKKAMMSALLLSTEKQTIANLGATVAEYGLAASIKATGAAIKTFMLTNPVGILLTIVSVVGLAATAFDSFTTSVEEHKEKLNELSDKYETTKSELESVTKELEEHIDKMDELSSKDNLTYVENGELSKLKDVTNELKVQQAILEEQAKTQAKITARQAVTTYNSQFGKGSVSQEGVDNYVSSSFSNGGELMYDPSNIEAITASFILLGKAKEEALASEDNDGYLYFLEIQDQSKELITNNISAIQASQSAMKDYYSTIKDIPVDRMTESQKEIYDTFNAMSNAIELMYKTVDSSNWNNMRFDDIFAIDGLEVTKEQLIELAKSGKLDESVISGYNNLKTAIDGTSFALSDGETSVSSFINQIYSLVVAEEEAVVSTDKLVSGLDSIDKNKDSIDKYQTIMKSFKDVLSDMSDIDPGDIIDLIQANPSADWNSYISGTKSLKDVLSELAMSQLKQLKTDIPELSSYFDDLFNDTFNEAASSVDDLCGALDTLSDKFKSLESAYKETQEDGFKFLSPEAMSGLKKDFGGLPGWDEFYKSVTEGNPSIEETRKLLSDLANTAVDNSDVMRNLTQANKDYAIASLEADGITNAKEVVNTRLNDLLSQQEQALNDLSSANMSTAVSGESLLDMTGAEVGALFEQMNQAGFTSQALYNLATHKGYVTDTVINTDGDNANLGQLITTSGNTVTAIGNIGKSINTFNNNPLTTDGSIRNLQAFYNSLKQTVASMNNAQSTFSAYNPMSGTNIVNSAKKELADIQFSGGNSKNTTNAAWNPSGDNTTYNPKDSGKSNSKKGPSSSKKETSEVFDWIENKLKNLANKTKKIADSIKDNMRSALKGSKLQSQIKSITNEITANEQAYDKYMKKADSVGLSSKYKKLVNEGSLDISTIKDESLINKIKSYEEWKNKADDCKSSISELKDTQAELFEQWANIPTEEAEKKIEKLTKNLDIIQGKSSIASMGGSAIARLNESANKSVNEARSKQIVASTLKASANMEAKMAKVSLTGVKLSSEQKKQLNSGQEISTKGLSKADAKKVKAYNKKITASNSANTAYANAKENYNTQKALADQIRTYGGSSYTVQNKLVDDEVSNMKSQNKANKTAYEKATKNANSALKEQTTAQKKVASAQNKLLNSKNLTDAQKKAIKSGKEVSLKGLSGSDLKNAKAYNEAVKKLKTTTDNYNTTLDKQAEAAQNAAQSEIELAQAEVEAEKTKFDNIQAYYSNKGNYLSSTTQAKSDAIALKEARGESLTSSDYNAQISAMSSERANMVEQQNKLQSQLNASVKSGKIKEGTEEWYEMKKQIAEVASGITAIDIEVEGLYDTLRENVDYRRFSDALDKAEQLRKSISSFSSLIDDDMLFDTDGNLTDFGLTKLGAEYANMEQYQNDVKTLLAEAAQLEKDKKDSSKHLSQSEYEEKMKQNQENLQNALQNIKSSRDTILSITKQMAQKELDALNKVIDARKKALQAKKDYYDYDKSIKSKTNEINLLKSQIEALSGVSDAQSKAEKARLEAQLAEAQDDLKDTVQDHIYNIQIEGLDDLKTELQEDYDYYINALSQNLDEIEKIMNGVGNTVSGAASTINETIQKILSRYGIKPSDIGLPGFASGGLVDAVKKNGDSGIASLKVGEYVLDTDMTKLATTTLPLLNRLATNSVLTDLANLNLSRGSTSGQTSVNINYDNMINIEGNANQDTVKEIEKMIPKISKAVQADIVRDRRKKG